MTAKMFGALAAAVFVAGCGSHAPEAKPAPPETHPIEVLTHCGLEFMKFGGRTWRVEAPQPEPAAKPDAQGVTRYTGYTSGTVTVVDQDTLRFAVDDDRFEAVELVFKPTTVKPPLCG